MMTDAAEFTPGPWQYVAGCEHHGPYVTSEFGNTICGCYTMTLPNEASTRNGGPSMPLPFLAEMADPNARLIAAAPELYEALIAILRHGELANVSAEPHAHTYTGGKKPASKDVWQFPRHMLTALETALAKARGDVA